MTCNRIEVPNLGVAIVCTRGRKTLKRCSCFNHAVDSTLRFPCLLSAELLCDKCDMRVCGDHSVQVSVDGAVRDFCARCFEPVWRYWCRVVMAELLVGVRREDRRQAFRRWAAENPSQFCGLRLSKKAQRSAG